MTLQADLVMSILVPAEAVGVARAVADAMRATGSTATVRGLQRRIPPIGVRDGLHNRRGGWRLHRRRNHRRIPSRGSRSPGFSRRAHAQVSWTSLKAKASSSRTSGPSIGRASGMKMCYASMTKGTNALRVAMLTAAESLGLYDDLIEELASSQGGALSAMESGIPGLPANAGRWIGEMEEIAETFESAGVTPRFHQGAAEIFRLPGLHAVRGREPGDHRPQQDPQGYD